MENRPAKRENGRVWRAEKTETENHTYEREHRQQACKNTSQEN